MSRTAGEVEAGRLLEQARSVAVALEQENAALLAEVDRLRSESEAKAKHLACEVEWARSTGRSVTLHGWEAHLPVAPAEPCGWCGEAATGYAYIGERRYCHDDAGPLTCYMLAGHGPVYTYTPAPADPQAVIAALLVMHGRTESGWCLECDVAWPCPTAEVLDRHGSSTATVERPGAVE